MTTHAPAVAPMPFLWRVGIGVGIVALGAGVFIARETVAAPAEGQPTDPRFLKVQAGVGIICFFSLCAMLSKNLRAVRLRTIVGGILLQFILAMSITHVEWVQAIFKVAGKAFTAMIACSDK